MKRITTVIFFLLTFSLVGFTSPNKIKVLILSGRNNHDWKTTTPKLKQIFEEVDLFEVSITETPERLKPEEVSNYDVLVSNWNSFPEKDVRWPAELEKALLTFIEEGGGFVTFHASTTAFYEWEQFTNISVGAWVEDTWHGKISNAQVSIQNKKHPVTKRMRDFNIEDELWVNAEKNNSFEILGSGENKDIQEKGIGKQPVILVKEYGKGRIFHTTLGHDVHTMQNTNFKILMLRGTEWAATGKVKQKNKFNKL